MGPRWVHPQLAKVGLVGPLYTRSFQAPSAFSPKKSTFGVGFLLQRPAASTSAQGAGGSPDRSCSCGKQRHRGETRKRCFPVQTRTGTELGFPRRVLLWRMQFSEACFVPILRWAPAGALPSCQRVGCCGQCTQGFFMLHPPSP